MTDQLDQSGNRYQTVNVYLGPSLGWVTVRVRPETQVTTTGTTTLQPDASVILVNVAATVTLNLPDVSTWVKENAAKPTTAFERSIFIKDFGQHASSFNITVHPFSGNLIDGSASDVVINTNGQMLRLYAMNDLTGWYVESNVNTTIADGSVTAAKLATDAVTTIKIQASAVTTAKINDAAVTNAKLANMAQATVKGRASGAGTGVPVDLTGDQVEALLLFTQTGTGAVQLALDARIKRQWLSVMDFGAVGDGTTDDTAAVQAAINQAIAANTSATVYFPVGSYKITTALSITSQITLIGDGAAVSLIKPAVTINGINISTTLPVTIQRLGIFYPSAANSGKYAIQVTGTGNGNSSSTFRDIQILNCYTGINFIAATAWIVDNAKIELFSSTGITVQNTGNVDAGDSIIQNCYLLGTGGPLAAIQWTSEGALTVSNNKCLSVQYGFLAQLASAAVTRQMFIIGNSFDGCTVAGVSFSRLGATGTFGGVVVSSNVFNLCTIGVSIPNDANGAWLTGISIVNNNYYDAGTAGNFFVNLNSITNFVVANNTVQSTVATTVLVLTAASTTSGIVGPNIKSGTFAANSIAGTTITTIAPN